jgi:hypothetical protein
MTEVNTIHETVINREPNAKLNVETGKITGTDNDAIFDKRAEAWRAEKLGAAETPVAKKHKV